jgi:hypothetical protein
MNRFLPALVRVFIRSQHRLMRGLVNCRLRSGNDNTTRRLFHIHHRTLHAMLIGVLICSGGSSSVDAALIDISVEGTWEVTNSNATINPFGLEDGDKFHVQATYDDTTLFNGDDGVTAALDPSIVMNTMINVVIPHNGPGLNPLVFTRADHISIGFAPWAQIEFDGTE